MRPFSRSRISFCVSPYSRHKTGLAGGTEDSLPSTVDPWMWPKEWTVVCCTWCQGAAWAARAGARHRQHMSLPAQCSAVGHRTRVSQAHSVVCSTVGVGVTQQPTLSRAGAWLWVGHCFACPVRGCRQWSWHGQPAAWPCRGEAQAQGWPRGTGPGCPGYLGDLGAPCRLWSVLMVTECGCKQPIWQGARAN